MKSQGGSANTNSRAGWIIPAESEDVMKHVLWFSRHEMNEEQRSALVAAVGEIEITQIDRTISSAYDLMDEIRAADILAIVAPINLQAQFLQIAEGKPVIIAKTKREFSEDGEKASFVFGGWKRLLKIEVLTEDFA